jgi:predicted ABC-type transport system involved in lysophospholipase L1 biosynthesis ATPase subunit
VIKVETLLAERMAGGTSVLLVTHDPNQAERLGHRRFRMMAGRLEAA